MKSSLSAEGFDVVYDINGAYYFSHFGITNPLWDVLLLRCFKDLIYLKSFSHFMKSIVFSGREAVEVEPILDALPNLEQ